MSCRNVEKRRRWSLKDFWEILFVCDLVKLMRSLVRIRPVLWRMFFDFFEPRWSLSCRNFGMMLLSLQRFRNVRLDIFFGEGNPKFAENVYFSKNILPVEIFNNGFKASTAFLLTLKILRGFRVVSVSWSMIWRQRFVKWTAMWHCSKLDNAIQDQTDGTILCSLRCHIIFVWIYFWFDAYF